MIYMTNNWLKTSKTYKKKRIQKLINRKRKRLIKKYFKFLVFSLTELHEKSS